jgi:type I restriction enzyme M protein
MSDILHQQSYPKDNPWIQEALGFAKSKGQLDYLSDVLVPIAIFILLRWADQKDAETPFGFEGTTPDRQLPESYRWSTWSKLPPEQLPQFLKEALWPALSNLQETNVANVLRNLAENFDPSKVDAELLRSAFSHVAALPFETVDDKERLAADFEKLIEVVISFTRYAGEISTPSQVVELILELAALKPGDQIYDPCFGFGGLLAAAGRRSSKAELSLKPETRPDVGGYTLYGIEIQSSIFIVGMARIILSGIDTPILECGDALKVNHGGDELPGKFGCIVAVTPVGRKAFDEQGSQLKIRADTIENLFLQHVMASLKPEGRAVIVLPEALLFRSDADLKVRKQLLREFCVEGVISLPPGVFRPYHNLKTCIIVFRKAAPDSFIWHQTIAVKSNRLGKGPLTFDPAVEAHIFHARVTSKNGWSTTLEEIKNRDYELIPQKSGTEVLTNFLSELQQQAPGTKIIKLNDVAHVFPGVNYDRADALERLELLEKSKELSGGAAPLVRVNDIHRGEIKQPSLMLTSKSLWGLSDRDRLHTGDIVISASGSVGKTALVLEPLAGAIPSKSLIVIRPNKHEESLQPFILSLLQSGPYQEWLVGHSMGGNIKHLPYRVLLSMPLPLPPPDIRDQIVATLVPNADVTAFMNAFVSGRKVDQLTSFLLTNETINELLNDSFTEEELGGKFDTLAKSLRVWREQGEAHQTGESALFDWLVGIAEISDSASDAFELPSSAERLAMIEGLIPQLTERRLALLEEASATRQRMKALILALERALEKGKQDVLNRIEISARVEPALIVSEKQTEVDIIIKNGGALPLRKFQIETDPEPSHAFFKILHTGKEVSWPVSISSRLVGTYPINVRWRAVRFDGMQISGEISLNFEVRPLKSEDSTESLMGSPYVVATPIDSVDRPDMFFGREDILNRIRRALRPEGPATVLLLEGNRRAGKSSVLKRLLLPTELPACWIPVYCSFQGAKGHKSMAGLEAKEIFFKIAREVILAIHQCGFPIEVEGIGEVTPLTSLHELKTRLLTKFKPQFKDDDSFVMLELHVDRAIEVTKPSSILLMLDEFDKIQEGIESGATSPQVPENIRYLFHSFNNLSGILTGARRIKSLRENHWSALYGIGLSINVSALDLEAARQLVTQPSAGSLVFATSARDRIIHLCARQPYLLQALCHRVFEECLDSGERSVTIRTVEAAASEMIEDNENFRTLWDYIETDRQRYIACMINKLQEGSDRLTRDILALKLEEDGIYYDNPVQLGDDLEGLREREVLRLERHALGSWYSMEVPLFSLWLDKNIDASIYRQRAKTERGA